MPSSPSNSRHVTVPNAILVLISVAVLASLAFLACQYRDMRVLRQELNATTSELRLLRTAPSVPAKQTPPSSTAMTGQPVVTKPTEMEWKTGTHQGITFSYPKNWQATTYNDEFVSGQKNLRLTSVPGKMRTDETGREDVLLFSVGYQISLQEIDERQGTEMRAEATSNPKVKRLIDMCDGVTCPDAQYLFEKNGRRYFIEAFYRVENPVEGAALIEKVVTSFK